MSRDAKYVVKWNEEAMYPRWELLETRAIGGFQVLETYSKKEDAVEDATKLARRENVKAAFYSKDHRDDRITATRDFR